MTREDEDVPAAKKKVAEKKPAAKAKKVAKKK
jgi:hypothetical protein